MNKILSVIACFAVLLFTVSAFNNRDYAAIGASAPEVVVSQGDSLSVSLETFKGKWVILSFWSSTDAVARLEQNALKNFSSSLQAKGDEVPPVEVISVNLDSSEALMHRIIELDNLDAAAQFRFDNADAALMAIEAFNMNEGLRSFLINPDGILVAADPTIEQMRRHIYGAA